MIYHNCSSTACVSSKGICCSYQVPITMLQALNFSHCVMATVLHSLCWSLCCRYYIVAVKLNHIERTYTHQSLQIVADKLRYNCYKYCQSIVKKWNFTYKFSTYK